MYTPCVHRALNELLDGVAWSLPDDGHLHVEDIEQLGFALRRLREADITPESVDSWTGCVVMPEGWMEKLA